MESIFYFANVFYSIRIVSVILLTLSSFTLGCILFSLIDYDWDDIYEDYKCLFNSSLIIFIVSLLLIIFVPDRKTYLLMKCGSVVDTMIENNSAITELPENTLILLNEYIKEETSKIKRKATNE